MRKLAVYTAKGGTAKTTTAYHLAAALADPERDRRVLLVDTDHQANLTYWCGVDEPPATLYDVAAGSSTLPAAIVQDVLEGVDLVPASADLVAVEPTLRARPGAELWMRRQVATLPHRWEWVIFDCGPGLDLIATATLAAVDRVLAPVEPHALGLAGVARVLETIDQVRELLHPPLELLGIVPIKVDTRTLLAREALAQLAEMLGEQLMTSTIPHTVRLAEAPSHHTSIYIYAPDNPAAAAYRGLAAEVVQRWPD